MMTPHFSTHLADDTATAAFGAALARVLQPGVFIHLHGDLGAGKTALTRALLQAAGHQGPVKSPTYTLAEPYRIVVGGRAVEAVHFDLYRLSSPEEFLDAGFRDYFGNDTICIVEWPEKAAGVLPMPDIQILLGIAGVARDIELHALSDKGRQCLAGLQFPPPPHP